MLVYADKQYFYFKNLHLNECYVIHGWCWEAYSSPEDTDQV